MKRIYPNTDLYFNLTINNIPINSALVQGIDFEFYTTNRAINIKKTESDIDKLNNIILEWDELSKLETGVLFYSYHLKIQDPTQTDGKIDRVENVQTEFYICNDTQDNIDLPLKADWGYIQGDINLQTDLIEYVKSQTINKLDKKEGYSLVNDTEIQRLSKVDNYDDTQIKADINLKANKSDVYTKEQIDNKGYLTEHQSLAEYATKAEMNEAINGLTSTINEINQMI